MARWTVDLRHPDGAWGWGAAAATLTVVVVPQLVVQAIMPVPHSAPVATAASGLLLHVVAVTSGVFMYLHHQLTRSHSTAWLAAGLIFVGGFGLTVTGLGAVTADRPATATLVVVDVVVVLALLGMVRIAERVALPVDPAAVGLVLALIVSALTIPIASAARDVDLPGPALTALSVPVVAIGAVVAAEVHRLGTLPAWARSRLAMAVVVLFAGRACMVAAGSGQLHVHLVSILLMSAAAALFLGTSLAVLRLAIHDDRLTITALQDEIASTASEAQADRERLHEVRGTIAGIASASRLIHHVPPLPGPSREALEEMLERETARLQRLMQGARGAAPRLLAIDDVLWPLVVARRAQGQQVVSRSSDLLAWAREDDLTEVLNILLENAAVHAPDATVSIFTREVRGYIEIVVADSGPGIPREQAAALFRRGTRGHDSSGEGLGLHVAQRLMACSAGYVRHDPSWQDGAAFVVGIRNVSPLSGGERHDAVHSIAQ